MAKVEREVPWCTIFLVVAALSCHSIVLYGNLETASALKSIGTSTRGWSQVGLGLARAFRDELDVLMGEITDQLGGAIEQTIVVQKYLDVVVSMVGDSTEDAGNQARSLLLLQGPGAVATLPDALLAGVNKTMEAVLIKLTKYLDLFLEKIKPALLKAGEMILKFGDKITQVLESFSLTLDNVQKMFDQVMSQLNTDAREGIDEEMMHDTFTLFDVSRTGTISEEDLTNVADLYSISALQGSKPKDLVGTYDQDGDKELNRKEFALMVNDPSIPKAMAVVLRAYAKRLSVVSGNVGAARKRDEVALAVTKYFQLVCAKNKTKLGWVSDTLGNGSLPLAFTADIFKNLAQQKDNPDVLTTADVGNVVISQMMELHPGQVMKAVDLLAVTEFWESEGFDPEDHPITMQRVTEWVSEAQKSRGGSLLEIDGGNFMSSETLDAMPAMAAMLAEENMERHMKAKHRTSAANRAKMWSTESAQYLKHHLLGGVAASDGADGASDAAKRCVDGGVPARPETLEFAQFLMWNSSSAADLFQKQSFEYTSESSSPLDSFANQIQGMVKKITGFVKMMEKYSTPAGIESLEEQIHGFAVKAGEDMIKVVNKKLEKVVHEGAPKMQKAIDGAVTKVGDTIAGTVGKVISGPLIDSLKPPIEEIVGKALNNTEAGKVIGDMLGDQVSDKVEGLAGAAIGKKVSDFLNNSINDAMEKAAGLVGNAMDNNDGKLLPILVQTSSGMETFAEQELMQQDLHGAFDKIATLLRTMIKFLPQATDNLKFAKQEVGEAAKVMDSVFINFKDKGPAIFDGVSMLWKTLWTLYFVFLLPLNLGVLFYSFWAGGYFGGPDKESEQEFVDDGPRTLSDRCKTCTAACGYCLMSFHDTQMCFWSCIILFEVVALLLFVVSLVLCIFGGVNTFLVAGCSQVYMLNDEKICYSTVSVLKKFLATFYVSDPDSSLEDVCGANNLMTCDLISSKMTSATIMTSVFSMLAVVLTFQLIIESACQHTRARYRRIINDMKDESDGDEQATQPYEEKKIEGKCVVS